MASSTQQTWVWANSRRWCRIGKPGVLQSIGLQRIRHDWVTEHQQSVPVGIIKKIFFCYVENCSLKIGTKITCTVKGSSIVPVVNVNSAFRKIYPHFRVKRMSLAWFLLGVSIIKCLCNQNTYKPTRHNCCEGKKWTLKWDKNWASFGPFTFLLRNQFSCHFINCSVLRKAELTTK